MKQIVLIISFLTPSLCFASLCCSKKMINQTKEESAPAHDNYQASSPQELFHSEIEIEIIAIANALTVMKEIGEDQDGTTLEKTTFINALRGIFRSYKEKYRLKSKKLHQWYLSKIDQLAKKEVSVTIEIVTYLKKHTTINRIIRKEFNRP